MEFNIRICQQILDTLPIGYYCGRRLSVVMDEKEPTSFYSPLTDSITISYPIIERGITALPDMEKDFEQAVRSMLYHETSHAILTPSHLMEYPPTEEGRTIVNIFEDERIETVLANFYRGVDFRKQKYAINGGPNENPATAEECFYNLVRFRVGPANFVQRVEDIIHEYQKLSRASHHYEIWSYYRQIMSLFDDLSKHLRKKRKTPADNPAQSFAPKKGKAHGKANACADIKDKKTATGGEITEEQAREIIHETMENPFGLRGEQQKEANKLIKTLEILFANFKKKNSGGNGINAYTGIFNPRAVVREDYRYFDRPINANGNNKFGTLHLNLFLDRSGSFDSNESLTNAILSALSDFERRNRNFSMDVYFINDEFVHAETVAQRQMVCGNGNTLPDNINDIFIKAQKPNTFNYNIVLFDGDAFSDGPGSLTQRKKLFKAFDKKQTFLISDRYNERYIDNFTAAKVITTNNYTDELIKNLGRALQIMLS